MATPAERQRLAALVSDYERSLICAGRAEIEQTIAIMSLAYPALRVTTDEAEARLELYIRELSDLPSDLLDIACRTALRELTFFPSIAEIRKRANGLAQRQWRLARIKHLIAKHDAEWRDPDTEERCTPAQAQQIRERFGIELPADKPDTSHRGKPIEPDAEWYRRHGVEGNNKRMGKTV